MEIYSDLVLQMENLNLLNLLNRTTKEKHEVAQTLLDLIVALFKA